MLSSHASWLGECMAPLQSLEVLLWLCPAHQGADCFTPQPDSPHPRSSPAGGLRSLSHPTGLRCDLVSHLGPQQRWLHPSQLCKSYITNDVVTPFFRSCCFFLDKKKKKDEKNLEEENRKPSMNPRACKSLALTQE